LDEFDITRQLGRITQDVWLELNDNLTAFEKIKVFNKIFYDFHHFSGNVENLLTPDSLYLNRLLETRKGNPLSLGILYSIIARSLKIPVYGVMLPEHFILACAKGEITSRMMEEGSGEILFYINPFNRGEMFTRNEVNTYLKQLNIVPKRKYFYPSNDLQIVKIMIQSLIASYIQLEAPDKVEELEDLQKILD
jgi:regulator of sirC expression with transglutaminase-like and TPR domain